ncbi:hypothetical protein AGDE_15455 [Angomonas deanei]|nr:hypothetical protein AGDE_15455 [Angomonas deanei]|eukprot:EPY19042.1 hypothetical protein AGDE_15455 [Angomonas deanei]
MSCERPVLESMDGGTPRRIRVRGVRRYPMTLRPSRHRWRGSRNYGIWGTRRNKKILFLCIFGVFYLFYILLFLRCFFFPFLCVFLDVTFPFFFLVCQNYFV